MEQAVKSFITGYLIFMSLIGFFTMGADKRKAVKKAWRIPERTLLLVAAAGGGMGAVLGMYFFHHKTKHIKFRIILPLTAILYLVLLFGLYKLI